MKRSNRSLASELRKTPKKKLQPPGPFETYLKERFLLNRVLAKTSEQQYEVACRLMDGFLRCIRAADHQVKNTDEDMLSRFLLYYEGKAGSTNSVRSKRRTLIAVVNHALERDKKKLDSRFIRLPKPKPTPKDVWTPEEVAFLVGVAAAIPQRLPNGTTKGEYFACLFLVAFESALRRGDLARLQTVDALRGSFELMQGKTGYPVGVELSPETVARIKRMPHVEAGSELVFPEWTMNHLDCLSNLTELEISSWRCCCSITFSASRILSGSHLLGRS